MDKQLKQLNVMNIYLKQIKVIDKQLKFLAKSNGYIMKRLKIANTLNNM